MYPLNTEVTYSDFNPYLREMCAVLRYALFACMIDIGIVKALEGRPFAESWSDEDW